MEINRDNYEEYFLLYADNELTDFEKIEVLKFIRANKDLEDEFKMIQDTICKPDVIEMESKASLLRINSNDFITEKNYEEIFVLYHDDELSSQEKNITEIFITQHPHLKKEFEATGIAKLQPDNSISFPGKKNLYKKEKAGKIVPLIFWRLIAAAVFVGLGLWIFQSYFNQPNQLPGIVKNVNPAKKAVIVSPETIPEDKTATSSMAKVNNRTKSISEKEKAVHKKEVLKQNVKDEKEKESYVQANKKSNNKIDFKNEEPETTQREVAVLKDEIKNIPQKKDIATNDISFSGDIEIKPVQKEMDNSQPAMQAHTASYIADANDKNENYVFYNVTTEEFRKSKVGGFLKKVKRIVERNNPVSRLFPGEEKQIASN